MKFHRISPCSIQEEFKKLGVDPIGIEIMSKKPRDFVFSIQDLPLSALHILKQEALSVGADLATPREAILCKKTHYPALLLGSHSALLRISKKCLSQPFGLKFLAQALKEHLLASPPSFIALMAVLNLTPDSFYANSRFTIQEALEEIEHFIELGVEIVDIGGASSRPGSKMLSAQEELSRLQPLLDAIKERNFAEHICFSIDTYNYQTADYALSRGFKILNDILGFQDERMLEVCAKHQAKAVLMHSRGIPENMQSLTHYNSLITEVDEFFEHNIERCKQAGIEEMILDIGFGFAKTLEQNLLLVRDLAHFKRFSLPLLVGASRKSSIGEITAQKEPANRLSGTLALHQIALENGANLLRVHDVRAHQDMIRIMQAFQRL